MSRGRTIVSAVASLLAAGACAAAPPATRPATDTPGLVQPPGHTIVLFNGGDWSGAWRTRDGKPSAWAVQDDGSVLVKGGDAVSVDEFGDFQLHLEFRCPEMPGAEGQARGNSGVYIHGRYEVQVLDSYGQLPSGGGCGAIYSIAAPLLHASRPAGTWQSYDMAFRAPRFDDAGAVTEPARITVMHNGVVIHNNLVLPHATPGGLGDEVVARGPILLQDHGDPVRYRAIHVRPLDWKPGSDGGS